MLFANFYPYLVYKMRPPNCCVHFNWHNLILHSLSLTWFSIWALTIRWNIVNINETSSAVSKITSCFLRKKQPLRCLPYLNSSLFLQIFIHISSKWKMRAPNTRTHFKHQTEERRYRVWTTMVAYITPLKYPNICPLGFPWAVFFIPHFVSLYLILRSFFFFSIWKLNIPWNC